MTNVLITGATSGIGLELTKLFVANSYHVVAIGRNQAKLNALVNFCQENYQKQPSIYEIDFAIDNRSELLNKLFKQENKHFHIVINNAGMLIHKPFLETSASDWHQLLHVNFLSVVEVIQQVLKCHQSSETMHIVNISSMGGFQGSVKFSGLSAYSATKAALANLTETLAEEYKQSSIKINCLALGAVQTPMLNQAFPDYVADVNALQMAQYIYQFSTASPLILNGKIIPISLSTP